MERPYKLRCHCGAIRLEVDADLAGLHECNCSICGRSGFIHWKVPAEVVRLATPDASLSTYVWRDPNGGQGFCPTCGTPVLRTGYGDRVSVNARCLDGVDVFDLDVDRYDGRTLMPPGPQY